MSSFLVLMGLFQFTQSLSKSVFILEEIVVINYCLWSGPFSRNRLSCIIFCYLSIPVLHLRTPPQLNSQHNNFVCIKYCNIHAINSTCAYVTYCIPLPHNPDFNSKGKFWFLSTSLTQFLNFPFS